VDGESCWKGKDREIKQFRRVCGTGLRGERVGVLDQGIQSPHAGRQLPPPPPPSLCADRLLYALRARAPVRRYQWTAYS
jgi:hypothetical protein